MKQTVDVLVVGAGIVGVACALELARAGLSVSVVDPSPPGSGATASGMGHLLVLDGSPEEVAISRYAHDLWQELTPELPPSCAYDPCGTIWVAEDDEELAAVSAKKAVYDDQGLSTAILDNQELLKLEPNVNKSLAGGLLVESDSIVYAPAVTEYLVEQAVLAGVEMNIGEAVVSIDNGRVTLHGGQAIEAGAVVNATGHWAPELTPGLPVIPRKGHLMITDRYRHYVNHELIELGYIKSAHGSETTSVACNVQPRPTGQLLLGSSRQFGDETLDICPDILTRLLRRIEVFLPDIRDLNIIRCWTGFRAATPDKLPLIGPWAKDSRLYLATGHEGLGITLALPTAKLIAAHILERPMPIPHAPYVPNRFLESNNG